MMNKKYIKIKIKRRIFDTMNYIEDSKVNNRNIYIFKFKV